MDETQVLVSWNLTNINEDTTKNAVYLANYPIICSFPSLQNITFDVSAETRSAIKQAVNINVWWS